ncbi:MAG TPA: hypothetical protein PLQ09_08545, partial [Prolixibacteraceae bacterium]|nr:hypothetical protein [Prolixibacteraceae bacterium]
THDFTFSFAKRHFSGWLSLYQCIVNVKLKRTSAYAQLFHANSYLTGGNYSKSPFYPVERLSFRFGILWSFYD